VTYAQPYPQYAYPPQQVVVQGPPPAQPTQVVVVYVATWYLFILYALVLIVWLICEIVNREQQPRTWTENAATAWLLFGIGFFFPICWCVGAVFIRSSDPAAR